MAEFPSVYKMAQFTSFNPQLPVVVKLVLVSAGKGVSNRGNGKIAVLETN